MLAGLAASSMDEAERSTEVSMEELAELVDTAGGEVAADRHLRPAAEFGAETADRNLTVGVDETFYGLSSFLHGRVSLQWSITLK